MECSTFAMYLQKIDETPSRNEMTELLAELLSEATAEEIMYVVYLALGNLGPLYNQVEFGISTKTMVKIIMEAFDVDEDAVKERYRESGDYGDVVYALKDNEGDEGTLTIHSVYDKLLNIATTSGSGSQAEKITQTAQLLQDLDPVSAKYVARIPIGKLRLGFSDVTILDALSYMLVGDKTYRKDIERAYNVSADIGLIAQKVKQGGVESLDEVTITVGIPIRPAAADRSPSAEAIIEKLGEVAAEPKIDGFRLQVHYQRHSEVKPKNLLNTNRSADEILRSAQDDENDTLSSCHLYSRNLEDMSPMFPEITQAISQLDVDSIILEGEAVAFNPDAEEFLPFQETIQRRRKYDVDEMSEQIPLTLFVFELMYLNGENYLTKPYTERRAKLEELFNLQGETIRLAEHEVFDDGEKLSEYFLEKIEQGLEGIMTKRLDAPYAAGARNSNWIKLKREEKGELDDSIDCVVLGYKYGTGKRSTFGIGAFLVGVYDQDQDVFTSISNVGTGLTDDQWREMKRRCDEIKADNKPARYDIHKDLEQDVWVEPEMVVEILADEITRSPLHSTGKAGVEPGYALRFPRLIQWRDDKDPEQATSVDEVKQLYDMQ